jgi:hypothetical protein
VIERAWAWWIDAGVWIAAALAAAIVIVAIACILWELEPPSSDDRD